jgi:hypothetical protein
VTMNLKINPAPISISVYDRLEHLSRCLDSIKANPLALETELYIFSDAPKSSDEERIDAVRKFCSEISGFKKVHLLCQTENNYKKNMTDARTIPLREHGKMIRLEDDNIVSPEFLKYMNEALDYYEKEPTVLGVSGYSPPISQEKYTEKDVYLSKIYSTWGHGTWANKSFLEFCLESAPYRDMLANDMQRKVRSFHPSLDRALKKIDEGSHYAPDQMLTYFLIKNDQFQVKPVKSLVKNIGHDGSGINCGVSSHFDHPVSLERVDSRLESLEYIAEIDRRQYRFFYPTLRVKISRRLKTFRNRLTQFLALSSPRV